MIASAACLANSSSRLASSGLKTLWGSRLNTTQEPMMVVRHQIGTPITPRSEARSASGTWPPGTIE